MLTKIYKFIGLCLLFLLGISTAFSGARHSNPAITQKNLAKHIEFLCSNTLGGRLTGSVGEKRAAHYIATQFQQLKLQPAGDNGTFLQDFTFRTSKKKQQQGRNVLATLIINPHATQMLIVGAHFDHLGNKKNRLYPGADDNASGVASVLEVAAKLSALHAQGKLHGDKNILFAAWSGEELGILGSSHFVKQFARAKSRHTVIDAAINLDMVGHLQKYLILQGTGSSMQWQALLNNMKEQHALPFVTQKDPYLPTDSTAFYLHRIPTLNFFTGAHTAYHSPNDKPETLNYAGIKAISNFLVDLLLTCEKISPPLTYHAMAKPNDSTDERTLRIYLGTIPDYAQSNKTGVTLSGVIKDSPAEQAGIQPNDIVITLGRKKIHDIYDYTSALNALTVKKRTPIVVLRHQSKRVLTIVPVYRS